MSIEILKNGYAMFLVSTSQAEILSTIVDYHYPIIKAMYFDSSEGKYHIIAEDR